MKKKNNDFLKNPNNHLPKTRLTFGQKISDKSTKFFGNWHFIAVLIVFLAVWISLNSAMLINKWDPYPFILLNFAVSLLTVFQASVILMSQNRGVDRDRTQAKYDYQINRKAEREIINVQKDLDFIKNILKKKFKK